MKWSMKLSDLLGRSDPDPTPPIVKFDHKATLPAGTLIQVNGLPFRVTNRTQIEGSLDAIQRAGVK